MKKVLEAGAAPATTYPAEINQGPRHDPVDREGSVPIQVKGDRTWLAAAAGALAAIGAASCCVVPLALFTLGISGAWIGNLTALAPYQPLFVAFAAAALLYGFFKVYKRPATRCDDGTYCAAPASNRILKIALWATTLLVIAAVAFPYVAAQFLEA